jgi:RNA polymerase sigma factor (sigma-70 family)
MMWSSVIHHDGSWTMTEQGVIAGLVPMTEDQRISEAIQREQPRLRNFIRRRVPDREDAEDILQEVFYELVEAYRMMKPVEQVTAWLFSVARNRITDLFRAKSREAARTEVACTDEGDARLPLEDWLPSPDAGPDAIYARRVLLEQLDTALDELPEEQREVFIAHQLMGYSFNEISERTGVSVNTLLSRKRYAILHLRERLAEIYDEFKKA